MGYPFPSEPWLLALQVVLNADEQYARTARNWEGDILCVVEAQAGPDWMAAFYLDLWHGACRQAKACSPGADGLPPAKFVLRASLPNFYKVIAGELDPMQAMMTRRLRVEGNMGYMLRNVPTVLDFVRCCRLVEIEPKLVFA
ncbi:MAG: SCP2 sterol-binding domain-containing protein [Anaerolineales bacterium]|nr:SCP2 sterol-binding domain-containing protein [Anaerolineales bacterium]